MSIPVNVCMSKIMRMPIKVGVRIYATYANCPTLTNKKTWKSPNFLLTKEIQRKFLTCDLVFTWVWLERVFYIIIRKAKQLDEGDCYERTMNTDLDYG